MYARTLSYPFALWIHRRSPCVWASWRCCSRAARSDCAAVIWEFRLFILYLYIILYCFGLCILTPCVCISVIRRNCLGGKHTVINAKVNLPYTTTTGFWTLTHTTGGEIAFFWNISKFFWTIICSDQTVKCLGYRLHLLLK